MHKTHDFVLPSSMMCEVRPIPFRWVRYVIMGLVDGTSLTRRQAVGVLGLVVQLVSSLEVQRLFRHRKVCHRYGGGIVKLCQATIGNRVGLVVGFIAIISAYYGHTLPPRTFSDRGNSKSVLYSLSRKTVCALVDGGAFAHETDARDRRHAGGGVSSKSRRTPPYDGPTRRSSIEAVKFGNS